jgi:hypothetical protein
MKSTEMIPLQRLMQGGAVQTGGQLPVHNIYSFKNESICDSGMCV